MADEGYNIKRVNFLIVEDNDHMRSLVRTILSTLGAQSIHEAAAVSAAFEILAVEPIDIVICDWEMSPINGLDFVRKIRRKEDSPNKFLPVIMLTAHSEAIRVAEARDCGINEFVVKPVSVKALYARIREIIRNPRQFVETPTYFGPDRRRRQMERPGDERRADGPTAELSNEEIKALLNG
jgi:two-component system chemotaxis response regulator CheY